MDTPDKKPQIYQPKVKRIRSVSPLWLLPIITLILASWLVYQSIQNAGDRIQIHFSDAQGLIAGRTPIKYQGLEVGMVRDIKLDKSADNIYVEADIYPEASYLLSENTRFWLVKPTASLSGVSGLDALISGNYIALLPGTASNAAPPLSYQALSNPPSDLGKTGGLNITLRANELGGINIGSAIVYKRIPIGEVYSYQLDSDEKAVLLQASIKEQYRHIITSKSRFWNVSGIAAQINMAGVDVQFDSLSALINGAIAVDSPDEGDSVTDKTEFKLYSDINAAGRGILINITLPENHNINENTSTINYHGIQIGLINRIQFDKKHHSIVATAAIQPAFADLLTSGSQLIIENAELSFSGVKNLSNLVKGNSLNLIPGSGQPSRFFTAINQDKFEQLPSNAIKVTLEGDDTYGIGVNSDVKYRGVPVGRLTNITLNKDKVIFELYIRKKFAHLIKSKNKFYVTGRMEAELKGSNMTLDMPPLSDFVIGAINFISDGDNKAQSIYHLYPDKSAASIAKYNQGGAVSYHLFAKKLPNIKINSPLLYHNISVGRIRQYSLTDTGVDIEIQVDKRYKHLVNNHSVFWEQSGIDINASLSGISIKTGSIESIVQGGIAFDTIAGKVNRVNGVWKLYQSYQQAMNYGVEINLVADHSHGLQPGMKIQYQDIDVGEVVRVTPNFETTNVNIVAQIYPQFSSQLVKTDSYFWISEAHSTVEQVKNLKNLLINKIEVIPGKDNSAIRKGQINYRLHTSPYINKGGLQLVLQSETRSSISTNDPIIYRGIVVGHIIDVHLGELADRVILIANIEKPYAYLVRKNSVFWNNSGVNISIGLTGAKVRTGSLDTILSGGIAFGTPETKQLQPAATQNDSYYLYASKEKEWDVWQQPIPKP
jgi:paraquat-inducible protein B